MKNHNYREFIKAVLTNLEPLYIKQGTTILDELEEVDEIIFCYSGVIYIGYEINKKRRFCVKYSNGGVIGAYGCTFNQRSNYIVYANSNSDCTFIRKQNWINNVLGVDQTITTIFKRKILNDHFFKLMVKIDIDKKRTL